MITTDRTPRSAETASELLSEVPGVSVNRLGGLGSSATLSIRGSTADQVGIYLDGIPLNTAVGGGVDLALLPLGSVDRMEIYRGMSPIGFGGSAIGGIVSLNTRVPTADGLDAEVGGGSFGTLFTSGEGRAVYGSTAGLIGFNFLRTEGDFTFVHPQNYQLTDESGANDIVLTQHNNDLRQLGGVARAVHRFSRQRRLMGSVWLLGRDQGLPGDATNRDENTLPPNARLITRRIIGALRYDSRGDLGAHSRLSAQLWAVGAEQRLLDEEGHIGLRQKTRDRTLRTGATAWASTLAFGWVRLKGTLEGRYERFFPRNELDPDSTGNESDPDPSGPASDRVLGSLGLEAQVPVKALALTLQPSFRLEVARDRIHHRDLFGRSALDAETVEHVFPAARLALVQRPASWLALKGNVGRYARLPSLREHFGNTGMYLGNTRLKPEKGLNADLGATFSMAWRHILSLDIEVAGFAAWMEDLIFLVKGGQQTKSKNSSSARILGVEAALRARVLRRGHLLAQATWTDAADTGDISGWSGNQLPLRPRYRLYVRPELRSMPIFGPVSLGAYLDFQHMAGNFLGLANLQKRPSRTLVGAGLHLDIAGTGLRLVASARNLTAAQVVDFVGYPQPGRSFYLTLKWSTDRIEGDS